MVLHRLLADIIRVLSCRRLLQMMVTMHSDNIMMMHRKGKMCTTDQTMTVMGTKMTVVRILTNLLNVFLYCKCTNKSRI